MSLSSHCQNDQINDIQLFAARCVEQNAQSNQLVSTLQHIKMIPVLFIVYTYLRLALGNSMYLSLRLVNFDHGRLQLSSDHHRNKKIQCNFVAVYRYITKSTSEKVEISHMNSSPLEFSGVVDQSKQGQIPTAGLHYYLRGNVVTRSKSYIT